MTSNKNCGIVYTRKQEPNSSLKGEAERQRKAVHHRRCNKRSKLDFNGLSFFRSQIRTADSERAAQLAEYQTGSEELREI